MPPPLHLYIGDWKDDIQDGKGIYKFHNGDIYEGDYVQGSHCGQCGLVNTVTVMATPLDVVLMNSEAKAILQRCDLKSRHYM